MSKKHFTLVILVLLFTKPVFTQQRYRDSTKLLLGISIGPTSEFRRVKLVDGNSLSYPYSYLDSRHISTQIPKAGFVLKLFIEKPLFHSPLSISSGFQFEDKGYKTRSTTDTLFMGSVLEKYIDHCRYSYFSIPFMLKYKILDKKIGVCVSSGLIYDFAARYRVVSDVPNNSTPSIGIHGNVSISIQIDLEFYSSRHFLLSFEPGFIQALKYNVPLAEVSNAYAGRLYSFIFPITMSRKF
jgi:hypothetical protein